MLGSEAGIINLLTICHLLNCSTLPTSNNLLSTERIPRNVFTYNGKNEPLAINNIFEVSPNPNHKINSGAIAKWGSVRSICSDGSSKRSVLYEKPTHKPAAKPSPPQLRNQAVPAKQICLNVSPAHRTRSS